MSGATGSYDTTAMRNCASELESAKDSVTALTNQLRGLPHGSVPAVVADALDRLSSKGKDMLSDIGDESTVLVNGLNRAAQAYEDMDNSLIRAFSAQ
jgi:hypothetical protein